VHRGGAGGDKKEVQELQPLEGGTMSSVKELLTKTDEERQAFGRALGNLRERISDLSERQRSHRVSRQLEKKKPVRERDFSTMCGKDTDIALEITVLLRAMRRLKGLPMTTIQRKICRCCGTVLSEREVEIHALPKNKPLRITVLEKMAQELINSAR